MSFIRVPVDVMQAEFFRILRGIGFNDGRAEACAGLFAANSLEGVYTHGVNRFSRFVEYVRKGYIKPDATATRVHSAGSIEQWDGRSGPGPLNAMQCTDRAMELASANGIGCVGLAFTNHWMRGGAYGWHAAKKGFAFIGWTNTVANMPAWGAVDSKLGNNPLVIAIPYGDDAIVLDMAMSQYSYGSLELYRMKGEKLPVPGGFDEQGEFTNDPSKILASGRPMPVGYWKGAGLSLLLDLLAAILSGGLSTSAISRQADEYHLSQVFIAINLSALGSGNSVGQVIRDVIDDYLRSEPADPSRSIRYPGQRVQETRQENLKMGIPVAEAVWERIRALR